MSRASVVFPRLASGERLGGVSYSRAPLTVHRLQSALRFVSGGRDVQYFPRQSKPNLHYHSDDSGSMSK